MPQKQQLKKLPNQKVKGKINQVKNKLPFTLLRSLSNDRDFLLI
jgi:hypothetical protein